MLHPGQGIDDILEVVDEESLLSDNIKLLYLLAGRSDSHLSPGVFGHNLEVLLEGLMKRKPRLMCVLGGLVISPFDGDNRIQSITEINGKIARVAEKDHHWLFFDPNSGVAPGCLPTKRFFDKDGLVNRAGCRIVAKGLVAASKGARMLQNYAVLPPKII